MRQFFRDVFKFLKDTFTNFSKGDPVVYSASIAFYTMLSLPGMIILIINSAGTLFGEEAVSGKLYEQINGIIGSEGAATVQRIVENASQSEDSTLATIISIATLLVSATTVLVSLQKALNRTWGVRAKPESKWWLKILLDRIFSLAMLISLGLLLAVSLILDTLISLLRDYLNQTFGELSVYLLWGINTLLSLGLATLIFALVFKILPDVKIRWRDVWVGAIITTLLFVAGKFLIGFYLGQSKMASTYGAASSFVIILFWVYFSSIIVLFGAQCTQVYARLFGKQLEPSRYAVKINSAQAEENNEVMDEP